MEIIIKDAVQTLKNNFCFRRSHSDSNILAFREFTIGIYNRFDELGLILSSLKDISFNEAIIELELNGWMDELKSIITPIKPKTK